MLAEYLIVICNFCLAEDDNSTITEKYNNLPDVGLPTFKEVDHIEDNESPVIKADLSEICPTTDGSNGLTEYDNATITDFPGADHVTDKSYAFVDDMSPTAIKEVLSETDPEINDGFVSIESEFYHIPFCKRSGFVARIMAENDSPLNIGTKLSKGSADCIAAFNKENDVLKGCRAVCNHDDIVKYKSISIPAGFQVTSGGVLPDEMPVCGNGLVADIRSINDQSQRNKLIQSNDSVKCRDYFNKERVILSECKAVCEEYDNPKAVPISGEGPVEAGGLPPGKVPICDDEFVAKIKARNDNLLVTFPSLESDECRNFFNKEQKILPNCKPVCGLVDDDAKIVQMSVDGFNDYIVKSGGLRPKYVGVCRDGSTVQQIRDRISLRRNGLTDPPDTDSIRCEDVFNNSGEIRPDCEAACEDLSKPKAIPISSYDHNANKSSILGGQQINSDLSIHALSFWDMLPNCLKEEWQLEHWMVFAAVVVLIICIHYCYSDTINLFSLTSLALVILVFFAGVKSGMFGLYKSCITDNLPFLTPSNEPFVIFLENLSVVLVTYIPCLCILNSLVNVGYEPTKQQYPGRNVTIKRVVCHEEEI